MGVMATYRVYFVEKDTQHYIGQPEVLECADDSDALAKAQHFVDGRDIEIWQSNRVVARLPSTD
jgi:hypothetical protein